MVVGHTSNTKPAVKRSLALFEQSAAAKMKM
jgi:hypothetical protein